ncbi:MAG: hypothetical protein RLO12_00265 [Fulvivirga sp.]|uniref:hypothetical protein n=1 Tax=Fulvivirga sp. TaxID=1931237 RepID=UPI0032F0F51F
MKKSNLLTILLLALFSLQSCSETELEEIVVLEDEQSEVVRGLDKSNEKGRVNSTDACQDVTIADYIQWGANFWNGNVVESELHVSFPNFTGVGYPNVNNTYNATFRVTYTGSGSPVGSNVQINFQNLSFSGNVATKTITMTSGVCDVGTANGVLRFTHKVQGSSTNYGMYKFELISVSGLAHSISPSATDLSHTYTLSSSCPSGYVWNGSTCVPQTCQYSNWDFQWHPTVYEGQAVGLILKSNNNKTKQLTHYKVKIESLSGRALKGWKGYVNGVQVSSIYGGYVAVNVATVDCGNSPTVSFQLKLDSAIDGWPYNEAFRITVFDMTGAHVGDNLILTVYKQPGTPQV